MVRSVVVAELLRARTKEFLLSAVAVELVPEARVLEARAPAERLAVPRRDAGHAGSRPVRTERFGFDGS